MFRTAHAEAVETPETRYAKTPDGLNIAYQTLGDGPRDILLLPFMGCIDVMWDEPSFAHVLHRIARIGRLISLDYRGTGASDNLSVPMLSGLEAWEPAIDDIRVVLDEVGSETVSIIAHGTAGPMGMLFAASYPQRTTALVLAETWARTTRDEDYPIGVTQEEQETYGQIVERDWGTGGNPFQAPSRKGDERFRRWLGRYERGGSGPATMMALLRLVIGIDLRAVLPTIRVPTLVLQKEANRVVPLDWGRYLADHIAGARLIVLPGSDNLFFTEAADEFIDNVEEFITGAPPVRDPDRALATVLFTDIVSSTERAAAEGDREWTRLLDQYDALASRELERHRGRKVNPTGDGMLATFDGPARAVRCAQAIIESARTTLGFEVRAGLHTGEVELRGDDIGGIAVHIGQRISALAGAGEVLVSRTVTDLVAGSGLEFDERGEHKLKGVPGEWRIYAVSGSD